MLDPADFLDNWSICTSNVSKIKSHLSKILTFDPFKDNENYLAAVREMMDFFGELALTLNTFMVHLKRQSEIHHATFSMTIEKFDNQLVQLMTIEDFVKDCIFNTEVNL